MIKDPSTLEALRAWASRPRAQWDYDTHEDGPDDIFRSLIRPIARVPPGQYFDCGSRRVADTPAALYRLLFLCRPESVEFSDMYKTRLFAFTSSDGRFLVSVELFKYELGLYFACTRECLLGKGSGVIAGWPGADNGWRCTEDGQAFFGLVWAMSHRKLEVYPGNNFSV